MQSDIFNNLWLFSILFTHVKLVLGKGAAGLTGRESGVDRLSKEHIEHAHL